MALLWHIRLSNSHHPFYIWSCKHCSSCIILFISCCTCELFLCLRDLSQSLRLGLHYIRNGYRGKIENLPKYTMIYKKNKCVCVQMYVYLILCLKCLHIICTLLIRLLISDDIIMFDSLLNRNRRYLFNFYKQIVTFKCYT